MLAVYVPLLALVAAVAAGPIASPAQGPKASITAAPTLAKRQDGPTVTTIPVSDCINYANPDAGGSGCYCSGYDSLLPMTTVNGEVCGYSQWVTATGTGAPNGFPFTKTESNSAIIAYATTTVYPGGGDWYGAGDSTVLQAGTSLSLQMGPTASANVGTVTDSGSALFTAVSSALASACPPPSGGATITSCTSHAQVTGLNYVDAHERYYDGSLDIDIPLISVSNPDVLNALIIYIAAGVQGNAASASNVNNVWYDCDKTQFPVCVGDGVDAPTVDLVNVPALMQAIFTEQTADTDGEVLTQNMEISMSMKAGGEDFVCSDVGLALSIMAAVGSVVPGFGWLGGAAVGSTTRAGLSLACNLDHL